MAVKSYRQPRLTNYVRLWQQRLARNWPFLLWLLALAFIFVFYSRNQQFGEISGSVEVVEESVVPRETARLMAVLVTPGQLVKAGDVVAQMDTHVIDAEMGVLDSTLQEAKETSSKSQRDMIAALNEAESAVQSAEADLLVRTMEQRRDAAQVEELRKELKRREGLLAKRLIDELQVNELRPELAALEQSLVGYPPLIANCESARLSAMKQLEALQNWMRVGTNGDVSAAISNKTDSSVAIVAAEREMCVRRRQEYTLKANRTGIVARVFISVGNVVPAGTPILSIVEGKPRHVIGFLPEFRPGSFAVGQSVMLWRQNENQGGVVAQRAAYMAIVEAVSPAVEALPVRISPMQVQVQGGQPLRGRRVIFRLPDEHDFSPGETVEIHEIHEGWRDIQRRLVMWLTGRIDPAAHSAGPAAGRPSE